MIITTFLATLTKAINSYMALDPESALRIKKLRGKAITIELLPFHLVFQLIFTDDTIEVKSDATIATETKIRGTPLQMLGVMLAQENRQRFFAEDLVIEGNAEFGQQVVALFDELQIDWEEQLSQWVGDVPAYHASKFIRGINQWLATTGDAMAQDINDYVHEEAGWFPTREALQDFFNDIDALRMDTDRIEAKLKHLQASIIENGASK